MICLYRADCLDRGLRLASLAKRSDCVIIFFRKAVWHNQTAWRLFVAQMLLASHNCICKVSFCGLAINDLAPQNSCLLSAPYGDLMRRPQACTAVSSRKMMQEYGFLQTGFCPSRHRAIRSELSQPVFLPSMQALCRAWPQLVC